MALQEDTTARQMIVTLSRKIGVSSSDMKLRVIEQGISRELAMTEFPYEMLQSGEGLQFIAGKRKLSVATVESMMKKSTPSSKASSDGVSRKSLDGGKRTTSGSHTGKSPRGTDSPSLRDPDRLVLQVSRPVKVGSEKQMETKTFAVQKDTTIKSFLKSVSRKLGTSVDSLQVLDLAEGDDERDHTILPVSDVIFPHAKRSSQLGLLEFGQIYPINCGGDGGEGRESTIRRRNTSVLLRVSATGEEVKTDLKTYQMRIPHLCVFLEGDDVPEECYMMLHACTSADSMVKAVTQMTGFKDASIRVGVKKPGEKGGEVGWLEEENNVFVAFENDLDRLVLRKNYAEIAVKPVPLKEDVQDGPSADGVQKLVVRLWRVVVQGGESKKEVKTFPVKADTSVTQFLSSVCRRMNFDGHNTAVLLLPSQTEKEKKAVQLQRKDLILPYLVDGERLAVLEGHNLISMEVEHHEAFMRSRTVSTPQRVKQAKDKADLSKSTNNADTSKYAGGEVALKKLKAVKRPQELMDNARPVSDLPHDKMIIRYFHQVQGESGGVDHREVKTFSVDRQSTVSSFIRSCARRFGIELDHLSLVQMPDREESNEGYILDPEDVFFPLLELGHDFVLMHKFGDILPLEVDHMRRKRVVRIFETTKDEEGHSKKQMKTFTLYPHTSMHDFLRTAARKMNTNLTQLKLVDYNSEKNTHKPFNPCGVRPYQHIVTGGKLAVIKNEKLLPVELETGKLQTRAADIGFETKETQKLIVRVWETTGEGENKKRVVRTFILSLGVTADQFGRLASRKLGCEEVQVVELSEKKSKEEDGATQAEEEKDSDEAEGEEKEKDEQPAYRVLEVNESPRELINEGAALAFVRLDTMVVLPFDISRTLKTKAEDVLGLEIYRDPVTGKRGYRWRHKKEDQPLSIGGPINVRHVTHVDHDWTWTSNTDEDVSDQFELEDKLGEGAFGAVYRSVHKPTGMEIAIKLLPRREGGADEETMREIEVLRKCNHDNIVKYYGCFLDESHLWVLMDYCQLGSVLDLMKTTGQNLTELQVASVLMYSLKGLLYLHDMSIIHCDLKAANILLNERGDVKLADFGVSRDLAKAPASLGDGEHEEEDEEQTGTPIFMAPEVLRGSKVSPLSDMWSLGVTAIEMVEGEPPHIKSNMMRVMYLIMEGPAPTLTEPSLWSDNFNNWLSQCLVKDPAERKSAKELMQHPFIVNAIMEGQRPLQDLILEGVEQTDMAEIHAEMPMALKTAKYMSKLFKLTTTATSKSTHKSSDMPKLATTTIDKKKSRRSRRKSERPNYHGTPEQGRSGKGGKVTCPSCGHHFRHADGGDAEPKEKKGDKGKDADKDADKDKDKDKDAGGGTAEEEPAATGEDGTGESSPATNNLTDLMGGASSGDNEGMQERISEMEMALSDLQDNIRSLALENMMLKQQVEEKDRQLQELVLGDG